MSSPATITVTSGPARGAVFVLDDELMHLGRGEANQIVLDDPDLSDHQASIVKRNGRYAIYSTGDAAIEVDGNAIPVEQWVWLPVSACIRVSERTALQFDSGGAATEGPATEGQVAEGQVAGGATASESKAASARPRRRKSRRDRSAAANKRAEKPRRRQIARFITDGGGEPLVQLGEDGHLPELNLAEGPPRAVTQKQTGASKSLGLFLAIGFSLFLSVVMLFVDTDPKGSTAQQRAEVRIAVQKFYGHPGEPLKPYQKLLRSAQRAHSRGDRAAEHHTYRQVLKLLNAEDLNPIIGLTGDRREKDERLRKQIAVLLGGG